MYWLRVENQCGTYSDTAYIYFDRIPELDLGEDTTLCFGTSLLLNGRVENASTYRWQDGGTGPTYKVVASGVYKVSVRRGYCSKRDSITVQFTDEIVVDLGEDSLLCLGQTLRLDAASLGATYKWNDGSQGSSIAVTNAGQYSVQVEVADCFAEKSININFEDCDVVLEIPNIFSPNNDAFNELWKPRISRNIDSMRTAVFNRWGQEVFSSTDLAIDWNGKDKEEKQLAVGVYFWIINYTDRYQNREQLYGTVTIVR